VTLGAVLIAVTGCAAEQPDSPRPNPVVAVPKPAGLQDPATLPPEQPAPPCDPLASLRPQNPFPSPGQMPPGSTMSEIVQRGALRVGVDQNMNLFGFRAPKDGTLQGYDIDYSREIAKAIFGDPNRVTFRTVTSANRLEVLERGEIDLIANSMSITCARKQLALFTTNYFDSGQRVMVREESGIQGISDLGGRKVCAPAGTTSIRTIAENPAKPIPVAVVDWTDCLMLLQQGRVDAISTTDSILIGLRQQDPDNTKIVGDRFTLEPHGFAISLRSPDLVRFVNGVLDQMRADGRWTALYNKWLGALGPVPPPPPAVYVD
jgi:polar amino acid transport system substrate-binding protein